LGIAGQLFSDFLPIILPLMGIGIAFAIWEALTKSSALEEDEEDK